MSKRAYVHYRDQGPSGPCGQAMSITAPWSKLYVWEGENAETDAEAFIRLIRNNHNFAGRRRPTIEAWWFSEDGNACEGPIVPEDLR